jgi:hypothetical protein
MHAEATPKQLRAFGLLVGAIFALIGVWPVVWRGHDLRLWAVLVAAALMGPALVRPGWLRRVYRGWMTVGEALGWINTRILLSVIFFGVFPPFGLWMRRRGRHPLRRGWEPEAATYREVRQPQPGSHRQQQF